MLFNSLAYALFLPLVAAVFFLLPNRHRWMWLVGASYFFYGFQQPEYLVLLMISTSVAYYCALGIEGSSRKPGKIAWLSASLATDLGMLFVFKYFGFFHSIIQMLTHPGQFMYDATTARLLLPAGISFYTFQNLGYVFDVFRGRIPAVRKFGTYAMFVSFFPQLVCGPIERAQALLPQLLREHQFDHVRVADGLKLILWGLFQKVLVADRLSLFVDEVYGLPSSTLVTGVDSLLATYFFALQIYFDFAGYSHIAIGSAKILGIELVDNFRHPYLAESVPEFWRRWHISLMSWLRDYIYYPLGGNRVGVGRWCLNIATVFLVSGLWHGANWTFLVWGALHGGYVVLSKTTERFRQVFVRLLLLDRLPLLHRAVRLLLVFNAVCFGWIWFRAKNLSDAVLIIGKIAHLHPADFSRLLFNIWDLEMACLMLFIAGVISLLQGWASPRHFLSDKPAWLRWGVCFLMAIALILFSPPHPDAFIYFQF